VEYREGNIAIWQVAPRNQLWDWLIPISAALAGWVVWLRRSRRTFS
jgi:hypothetical protein